MSEPLTLLLVEDSEDDAFLTQRELSRAGFELDCLRVDTAAQMWTALTERAWDVVISDYHMPGFTGSCALQLLHKAEQDIPFIIVSGAIGEETAVALMRAGAHDYVMKDNLVRLAPAVQRELREAGERCARRRAEAELRLTAKVFESSVEGIVITDEDTRIIRVNDAFVNITGFSRAEAIGQRPHMLQSGYHPDSFYRQLWDQLSETGSWQGRIRNRRKNGELYLEQLSISAVTDDAGRVTNYIGGFTDLSEQEQSAKRIEELEHTDELTKLPNRTRFCYHFRQCMEHSQSNHDHTAFIHLDLDRFIYVNDTFGNVVGDQLLRQVGQKLSELVRSVGFVARLGGDDFAIAVPKLMKRADLDALLAEIGRVFEEPFFIAEQDVFIVPSMGAAMYPDDVSHADDDLAYDELARYAETALQSAKKQGEKYQFYDSSMNAGAHARLTLEGALRRALERDEFRLFYQPQIDVVSGKVIAVEALLRWERGDQGMVMPNDFIPLLEDTGLIIPVGEWVLQRACQDQRQWTAAGHTAVAVAVNLSPRQFRNRDLVHMIGRVLEESKMPPQLLELEMTESSIMDDPEFALQTLGACHDRGIRISIDDFGTGYSSLSYLKRFPLDVLKIDRSFVIDVPGDGDDAAIIEAIIAMAHRLKLRVIAEGVETVEQQDFLRKHDCDAVQGYFFARPMPFDDLLQYLQDCAE